MARVGVLLVILRVSMASNLHVEMETKAGRVRGTVLKVFGKRVEQYQGIPFAEPPIGELRFRPPRPKNPWTGTLDATVSAAATACPQFTRGSAAISARSKTVASNAHLAAQGRDLTPIVPISMVERAGLGMHGVTYTEDCLRLNLWVSERASIFSSTRPVLVWIHGGGFNYGSGTQANYSGATIAAMTDVLVVSINYRLGILGFMNADSPEAPGNAGLLDQVMALQWVQRNIESFGGDPHLVTLFGESAGAASAHAHVLSPLSEGLFTRVVLMSGSISNVDMWDMIHESMIKANKVADMVGCSKGGTVDVSSNAGEIVECFRRMPAEELVRAAAESLAPKVTAFLPTYHDTFLPRMPLAALKQGFFGSVDILAGVTSDEAALSLLASANDELLTEHLRASPGLADTLKTAVWPWVKMDTPDIISEYQADAPKDDGDALRRQYIDYLSDRMFNCPLRLLAEKHSKSGSNVFAYVFGHKSSTAPFPNWIGTPHTSDLAFAFGHAYAKQPDSADGRMSEAFVRILATFAEIGVPELPSGQKWPKYTRSSPVMVFMANGQFNETQDFRKKHCERWKSVL